MYGETPDYDESKNRRKQKQKVQICLLVAFKNGNKISIQEAVK
jgi:hypothetical protein